MTPYRWRPHERPGSSGRKSLVAATSQSVRCARSLATRCDVGRPHLRVHTWIFPLKWVGGKRACTLVALHGTVPMTILLYHKHAWIASRTFAVFSGVVRVHGRPERSWSSTDVRPWSVCTIKKFCFFSWHYLRRLPVAFDGFLQQFSLRLKQNLMQFLCFVKLVISVVKKKFAGSLKHNLTKTHWT